MASTIDTSGIDATKPTATAATTASVRANFAATKTQLGQAGKELSALQKVRGFRNLLPNAGFQVWDAYAPVTTSVNANFAKGWNGGPGIGGTYTVERFSFAPGEAPFKGAKYGLRITWTAAPDQGEAQHGASGRFTFLENHAIRDIHVGDDEVTHVAFAARVVSGPSSLALTPIIWQAFQTGAGVPGTDYELFEASGDSATVRIALGAPGAAASVTLTSAWQVLEKTIVLPSLEGRTLDSSSYLGYGYDLNAFDLTDGTVIELAPAMMEYGDAFTEYEEVPDRFERVRLMSSPFASLPGGFGMLVHKGIDTFDVVTLTGTANQIAVANGTGIGGNPTLSIPSVFAAPGSIQSVGSITAGNALAVNAGGAAITGNSSVAGTLQVQGALTVTTGGAAITGSVTGLSSLLIGGGANFNEQLHVEAASGDAMINLRTPSGSGNAIFRWGNAGAGYGEIKFDRANTRMTAGTSSLADAITWTTTNQVTLGGPPGGACLTVTNGATGTVSHGTGGTLVYADGTVGLGPPFTVATLPSAALGRRWAWVSNEVGGPTPVYSDLTNWRRPIDGAVASA